MVVSVRELRGKEQCWDAVTSSTRRLLYKMPTNQSVLVIISGDG